MSLWLRDRFSLATVLAVAFLILAPSSATATAVGAAEPNPLLERYRVDVSDDGIELTPIAGDSAVEAIELLDDEDEALVNGKPFSRAELVAFLGEDGRAIAALVELSDRERRRSVGWVDPELEAEVRDDRDASDRQLPPRPPRPPRPPHVYVHSDGGERISFGQSITVAAGETVREAVCIGCSITVEGEVESEAVAVGGRIEVAPGGRIGGDAVSVGARVDVASGAVIEGDAVAVGGRVHIEDGGTVEGQRSSVGWGAGWFGGPTRGFVPFDFSGDFSDLFWSLLRTIFLGLFAAIAVLFARRPIENASLRVTEEPWRAVVAGLLTQLLFFPVLVLATVILAVSVIGIPLLVLVPVAVLAFFVAMAMGYVAVAQALGRWGRERFGWTISEPYLVVFVGVVLIQGITLVGRFVSLFGMIAGMIGFAFLCLGFFVKYVAWTIGLGGMVLTMRGRNWRRPLARRAPEPPLAPIDFTRDDAPPPPPPSAKRAAPAADAAEVTESVDEAELRERELREPRAD